mgnify:CR=1 FL=1
MLHVRLNYINTCQFCKKEFHPFKRGAKYCGRECFDKFREKGREIKCFFCGKLVYKKLKVIKKHALLYCSKECKDSDSIYKETNKKLQSQARWFVYQKIRKGIIKRGDCQLCGRKNADAHHYKGYKKENWIKIKWLCRFCHSKEHQKAIRVKNGIL